MTQKDIQFVNAHIYAIMLPIMHDSIDSGKIADNITNEVIEDIMETADSDNWTSEDVRIAVARVIKKKLNID